ncbi:MAG: hypothetical protein ACKPKO_50180, partial [Candidatus Fonsibacter sp.]
VPFDSEHIMGYLSDPSDDDMEVDHPHYDKRWYPWERWENTVDELTASASLATLSSTYKGLFSMPLASDVGVPQH